jgi:hypothetical protein
VPAVTRRAPKTPPAAPADPAAYERALHRAVAEYYADPLGFVLFAYPWRQSGTFLEQHDGPDVWQAEFLRRLGAHVRQRGFNGLHPVDPIRMAVSKGHGVGGSAVAAWLVDWIMSTRPHAQGTVTANTHMQLATKTWAAVQRWTSVCKTAHWFNVNNDRMYRKGFRESWFCSPQTCDAKNSEAFAGQHAADSTSFYIFDEDSNVPDVVHDVAEGGMTDGEPMQFLFGNPTRSTGAFYEAVFGRWRNRYDGMVVDSRTSRFANHRLHAEWIQDRGLQSDFVRTRVLGLPPNASDAQYIGSALVRAATERAGAAFPDDPLVCGLDIARGGSDDCVFWFRRGVDARSIPPIVIPGEEMRDSMRLVTVAADVLGRVYDGHRVQVLTVDATGIGGPVGDRLRQMGFGHVVDVQFGGESPDAQVANMRGYMWKRLRDWLPMGLIPGAPDTVGARLETDLTGPGYYHDKRDRLVLESKEDMKKRGLDSPDFGDALALTFAVSAPPVATRKVEEEAYAPRGRSWMAG